MRALTASVGSLLLLTACTAQQATVLTEPMDTATQETSFSSFSSSPSSPPLLLSSSHSSPPLSIRIDLPFASQAPTGDWGYPFQEACEEASLIIVHHYLSKQPLDASVMQQSILDLVAWQTERGLPQDITVAQLGDVAREYYGYDAEVFEGDEVTTDRIERELARGNPVIVPLAGQMLGNPYYSGSGPPYHMLVIVGYDAKNFLTHDVGTRRGEYYSYRKEVLMNAIHDWTGSKETIRNGEKRMMVIR